MHNGIYLIFIIICAALLFPCLVRAIKGPALMDRLMSINMSGTMIIAAIVILSVYSGESSFIDIALIYAALSFIVMIIITHVAVRTKEMNRDRDRRTGEGKDADS